MLKKLMCVVFCGAILTLASTSQAVVVGDWEDGMDGWELLVDDAPAGSSTEFSTQGVTSGEQSLKVAIPEGGWQQALMLNINALGLTAEFRKHTTFSVDVTRLAADWTGDPADGHSGLHLVINAGGDGWSIWEQTDYLNWWKYDQGDQTQTLTWDYSAALAKIDFSNLWWLELRIATNYDAAYTTGGVYYLDNAQLTGTAASNTKATDVVIGNFEQSMDGWETGGDADVLYNDSNGVTQDQYSLDVWVPTGAWAAVLTMNMLDPNNAAVMDAFRANTKIAADITRLVADWPVDDIPGWNGIHMVINCGGDGWSLWQDLGYQAGWQQPQGDLTQTATWNYADYLSQIQFDNLQWFTLEVTVNANDPEYTGWVWFYIDNIRLSGGGIAMNPQPASGAKDVNVDTQLSWSAGAHATSHNLYLGTSQTAVNGADGDSDPSVIFVPLDGTSFDPNGLNFATRYFWRVDAVNDVNPDSPWKGPVWSFTTANFIVVDDFESYTDEEGSQIFATWVDGWTDTAYGGSQVGYTNAPFAEQTTVHAGSQAMPLDYDNTLANVSETVRTWTEPQDWTLNNYNTLKLYIQGRANNGVDTLYITLEDSAGTAATVKSTDPAIMTTEAWTEWTIPTDEFTGVNMAAITRMTIGVGDPQGGLSGAQGTLLIDDIEVGARPLGLVAYYALEGNLEDSSGNGFNGMLAGDPNYPVSYVAGPAGLGQGLSFEGTGGHQYVDLGTFNPSAATGQLTVSLWAKWDGLSQAWQGLIGKRRDTWAADSMMWQIEANQTTGALHFQREGTGDIELTTSLPIGQWTHIAVTFDGTTAKGYINGVETVSGTFSFGFDPEAPIQFGADTAGGGNAFNGALDEVRIYDRVLSDAEVLELAGK